MVGAAAAYMVYEMKIGVEHVDMRLQKNASAAHTVNNLLCDTLAKIRLETLQESPQGTH